MVGRVTAKFGDRESGRGSDAELRRASSAMFSSGDGRFTSILGALELGPGGEGLVAGDRGVLGVLAGDFAGDLAWEPPAACALGSGALVTRPSFALLDLVLAGPTVCARVGAMFFTGVGAGAASDIVSTGRGFLACATAKGPAQWGRIGHAMLASTKLPSTVTGRIFSVIFSFLAVSDRPKTMCWTLL